MNGEEFRRRWLERFAEGVSAEDMEKYVVSMGNYIWHIFSWELIEKGRYLTGDAARRAYDKAEKNGAVWLDPFAGEGGWLTPQMECAGELEKRTEIYIAGRDFAWTYIKTHERDLCGPYFMKLDE